MQDVRHYHSNDRCHNLLGVRTGRGTTLHAERAHALPLWSSEPWVAEVATVVVLIVAPLAFIAIVELLSNALLPTSYSLAEQIAKTIGVFGLCTNYTR